MRLLLIITNKGNANTVCEYINRFNLMASTTFIGKGTASNEILETLSLIAQDKEVVLGFAEDSDVELMFEKLESEFEFTKKGMGVACSFALNGITAKTLSYIQNNMIQEVK